MLLIARLPIRFELLSLYNYLNSEEQTNGKALEAMAADLLTILTSKELDIIALEDIAEHYSNMISSTSSSYSSKKIFETYSWILTSLRYETTGIDIEKVVTIELRLPSTVIMDFHQPTIEELLWPDIF